MTNEELKERIIERSTDYLKRDRSGKGYICPICGSGSGENGTGITTKDGRHFTCWRGCFTNSDIIDIIGLQRGLPENDFVGKLHAAADELGISIDGEAMPIKKRVTAPAQKQQTDEEVDYTDFIERAAQNIEQTDYHRGLSLETLRMFRVGFVKEWRHPNTKKTVPLSPRLIIPNGNTTYLARDTRDSLTDEQKKYTKSRVGHTQLFNYAPMISTKQPFFITEGEIDAMSICDVGGDAVGLCSTSQAEALINLVTIQKPYRAMILALDTDDAGSKTTEKLKKKLTELDVPFIVADISSPYKDPNEALIADRESFRQRVADAVAQAVQYEEERERRLADEKSAQEEIDNQNLRQLRQTAAAYSLQGFLDEIEKSRTRTLIPTGFRDFDSLLDGGMFPGLYIVGAITSLGKTSFVLQLADQIAQGGRDVLFFSLEMSQHELIARSVSRESYLLDTTDFKVNAKTTRGILTGSKWDGYSEREKTLIHDSIESYKMYARHLYFVEGNGEYGTKQIREKVENHKNLTGQAPVVIVDYVQLLAPKNPKSTDKQNTDTNILELKRISRDFDVPLIGISSFNRDSYTDPVNLAAFKESGAIEYSADILIGLQYDGMDFQDSENEKSRNSRIRELLRDMEDRARNAQSQSVEVKILKNRNGSRGSFLLDFKPMFNIFSEPTVKSKGSEWNEVQSNYRTR